MTRRPSSGASAAMRQPYACECWPVIASQYGPLRVGSWGDGVVDVTIDHPPTNLVDGPFLAALVSLVDDLDRDGTVRVVVFRSADPDFFLMHADVELLL